MKNAAFALLLLTLAPVALAQRSGVTLHAGTRLNGVSMTFYDDEADLADTRFGSNRARSVSVSPGCVATLYSRRGFRGDSITLRGDDNDLGNTQLGRDAASSLRVSCGPDRPGRPYEEPSGRGVTLYRLRGLAGPGETFDRDVPDLRKTAIGAGRARSVDVSPGCVATLFEEPYYEGRSVTVRERDNDLGNTKVGEGTSSLRVDCGGRRDDPPRRYEPQPRPQRGPGVTLFRDREHEGPSETFTRDVADLSRTTIGSATASSVGVSSGCVATLYERPYYRGRSVTVREDDLNLGNTDVGEDTVSSIQVRCGGDGYGRPYETNPSDDTRKGVTLYRDRSLSGPSVTFHGDVPDLSRTVLGARTASSIRVPSGCEATLYEAPGYGGRWTTFRDTDNNLANTTVGEDSVSSLRIRCR